MVVLIDGFNLLHAARVSLKGSPDLSRSGLCRILGDWVDVTAHRVTIVFDGRTASTALAQQLGDPRIRVLDSGPDRTADDHLAEILQRYSGARDVLVVSSDREVQRSAKRRQARFAESENFFERVADELRRAARRSNGTDEKDHARDEQARDWLRRFGYDPDQPPPFDHP